MVYAAARIKLLSSKKKSATVIKIIPSTTALAYFKMEKICTIWKLGIACHLWSLEDEAGCVCQGHACGWLSQAKQVSHKGITL